MKDKKELSIDSDLVNFFALLLKIDRRNNKELYNNDEIIEDTSSEVHS